MVQPSGRVNAVSEATNTRDKFRNFGRSRTFVSAETFWVSTRSPLEAGFAESDLSGEAREAMRRPRLKKFEFWNFSVGSFDLLLLRNDPWVLGSTDDDADVDDDGDSCDPAKLFGRTLDTRTNGIFESWLVATKRISGSLPRKVRRTLAASRDTWEILQPSNKKFFRTSCPKICISFEQSNEDSKPAKMLSKKSRLR